MITIEFNAITTEELNVPKVPYHNIRGNWKTNSNLRLVREDICKRIFKNVGHDEAFLTHMLSNPPQMTLEVN